MPRVSRAAFRKHRIKISILATVLIFLVAGVGLYQYYQGEEERKIINILKEKGMWNPNLNYERFAYIDVDHLPKQNGFWAYKTVNVTYQISHYNTGGQFILCLTPTSKSNVFVTAINNVTAHNPDWKVLVPPPIEARYPFCGVVFPLEYPKLNAHIQYHIYLYYIDNSKFQM